jgi:5'(3')-deoxyribonucleotidase
MTIGRSRYPYAKTDMEMLASWFYDADKIAQKREAEIEDMSDENNSAIGFIELQVNDLNDEIKKMQAEILNLTPEPAKRNSIFSKESINEIRSSEIGRGQTSAELDDPGADVAIAGALKNGMKVGVEYTGGDLEVSLYGLQKKPVVIGRISMRKEGGTYVSAYSRLSRKYQGQGLGLQLYQFVIAEMGILLKSDLTQSKGSQSVWRKLASTPGINVYGFRAVPGKKREYFTVEPDELNQLNGHLQVYDNEEVEDISTDLGEYELDVMHQEREGEISTTEAWKRINKERAKAKKEMTEFEQAGQYTWLLATSKKEKAKKLENVNGRMRILPLVEDDKPKPEVYVDLDGVLVDFFSEWAKIHGVDHWKKIAPKMKSQGKTIEDALDLVRQTKDFWINLKPESGINELLGGIKKYAGSYTVLSSPLSNDPTSEPQKREWVKNNLAAFPPKKVIIFKNKAKYATQADGTPNILIDDFSEQINPWKAAGGIGIKHSNSGVKKSVAQLQQAFGDVEQSTKDRGSFTSKSKAHDVKIRPGSTSGDDAGGIGSKIKGAYNSAVAFGNKQKSIAQKFAGMGQNIDQRPGRQKTNSSFEFELPPKKKRNKKTDKDWSLLRLALEDNIVLEKANGDCFPVAGRAMLDAGDEMEKNGFKLVHALVSGEGDLKGRKFFHAFNMLGDIIFDNSNGKNIMTRKEIYFEQGGIDPNLKGGFVTYNVEEALLNMAREMHWGPWDLDYSLEEDLPDSKGEIGKEKLRISSSELEVIKRELTTEENVKVKWENFKNGKMARPS